MRTTKLPSTLVLHCPYEQTTQPCKAQLCRDMQDAHMFKWQVPHSDISPERWQLATNTIIIFLLLNGCLLLCPHRLRHMRPRSIGLIPSLPGNTKLSKVEQNTHMAMQLAHTAAKEDITKR